MSVSPIWPAGSAVNDEGEITFHGRTAASLLDEFGSPLYVIDTDDVRARATKFVHAASHAFNNTVTHVSFAGKALLSKEICRIVTESGMLIDTCTMGEMRIALAAGVPGRRLVLHGNNKSDAEIELAIEQGFNKIVIDEPDEPARIAAIAKRLGKRARVMLRVTSGIHAGGHEFVSTAHEDQKFGVALLPAGADTAKLGVLDDLTDVTPAGSNARLGENAADAADQAAHAGHAERKLQYDIKYPYDMSHEKVSEGDRKLAEAMTMVADGPALAVLKDIYRRQDVLELVGVHSHIGSNIHDADAFIQAAKRMMLLRKTFYATDAYTLPEVDLGGGYSVAYTDGEDSMDIDVELGRLADAVGTVNRALGMPAPVISFEPGRWTVAPTGVTLYRVGTVKPVELSGEAKDKSGNPVTERVYVSVDGGMSDNIRPALYGSDYTARLANRKGSEQTKLCRVVGMHCESGDIVVNEVRLPADIKRGDILAVPVTGRIRPHDGQQLQPGADSRRGRRRRGRCARHDPPADDRRSAGLGRQRIVHDCVSRYGRFSGFLAGKASETVHFLDIPRPYVILRPYNKQGHTNTSHSREDALVQEDVAPIRVGLLGAGTVGSQTARLLVEQKDELAARIGRPIELTGVACLDPAETDPFPWIDKAIVTTDTMSVATNSDIVIELIGGTGVARKFVLAAIESGASVVTANKALLAKYGPEIYAAAEAKGVDIYFEASVGGAIPFLKPLRESLVGDKVTSMLGIVNGTTNYILDEMTTKGLDFDDVLKDAQAKGYAEADPTGDIEGYDAANKAAIMATLGFHTSVTIGDVSVEGITKITADDIAAATAENKVIKLLAVVENTDAGVSARVYPALISNTHPLASVHGSFNAVFVKAEAADDLMFYGRGAGGAPTASAVVGDVVTEARHIAQGCTGPSIPLYKDLKKAPIEASKAEFAVRFVIHDNPGVLAAIAAKFADHGVSINGVNQDLKPTLKDPGYDGELQQLRLVTHMTDELTLRETVKDVCELDCVCGEPSILRVLN